ncbi:MAG: hypothetical protein FWF25_08720 [Propionibacteriaceae bacterium]|nr:hypothetical protein [Propionibacteriaceae bacterium]
MDSEPSCESVAEYPLMYEDEFGVVETVFHSDGHSFMFQLRDWTFSGQAFDCLWVDGSELTVIPAGELGSSVSPM